MKNFAISFFLVMSLATTAFAALNNNNKQVSMVEYMTDDTLRIHLTSDMDSPPTCSADATIVGCSLSNEACQGAARIATAAQLSGRDIEFSVHTNCLPNTTVAKFGRIRMH